jgi:glutaminase
LPPPTQDHRAFNPYVSTGAEIIWSLLDASAQGQYRDTIELNRLAWARLSAGAGGTVRMRTHVSNNQDAAEAIKQLPEDPEELSKLGGASNLAALYVMAANLVHLGGLPANASIDGTFQGFVQVNNLRLTPQMMAMAAATLANGGVNPVTKERVLSYRLVRYLLTTMMTAGLYDGSGRWAYTVGMPAKSGVGGGLLVVAPGVGGFATVSEPLDLQGNSARGLAFFSGLAHKFPFLHSFTPGAGSNPNLALTPVQECNLTSNTVEQEPGEYSPG